MNTLQLLVAKALKDHGYIPQTELVIAGAEYIEMRNSVKIPSDEIYTPLMWIREIEQTGSDELKCKVIACKEICNYLASQRDLCIDQTGCDFCMEDIIGHFEAPDFIEEFGDYHIDIGDIFNFLLVYYQKHEKGDMVRERDLL